MNTESVERYIGSESKPHSSKLKVLTTCAVLFGNITFGFGLNFFGPVLEELRIKYGTTVDHISVIFTIILVAYCVGALTSGFVYNYVINRQMGAILCLGVMGFSLYLTPHLSSITDFFWLCGFFGYFVGGYDTAQIIWIIEIWQSKAGPYIQAQHFCYALGTILAPLVIQPFLETKSGDNSNQTTTTPATPENLKLYIPFTIAGSVVSVACSFQIYLFIFHRYYTPPMENLQNESIQSVEVDDVEASEADLLIPNSSSSLNSTYSQSDDHRVIATGINWSRLRFIVLSAMFLGFYAGMEMCTIQFIPTFAQYSDLKLPGSEAAFILSGLTGAFAMGRFIGIFVIMKVPSHVMLCGNIILALIGNLVLYFYGSYNLTMLWAGCIIVGLGYSTTYPTFCAFMEKHLIFTNAVGSCMIVSGSTLGAIYPIIVGKRIVENVVVLTYTNFVSICVCSLALFTSYVLTYKNKSKVG